MFVCLPRVIDEVIYKPVDKISTFAIRMLQQINYENLDAIRQKVPYSKIVAWSSVLSRTLE